MIKYLSKVKPYLDIQTISSIMPLVKLFIIIHELMLMKILEENPTHAQNNCVKKRYDPVSLTLLRKNPLH